MAFERAVGVPDDALAVVAHLAGVVVVEIDVRKCPTIQTALSGPLALPDTQLRIVYLEKYVRLWFLSNLVFFCQFSFVFIHDVKGGSPF